MTVDYHRPSSKKHPRLLIGGGGLILIALVNLIGSLGVHPVI